MRKFLLKYLDDLLLILGCGCILYGLSMWNGVITWIVGGLMLAGIGVLVGKMKAASGQETTGSTKGKSVE